MLLLRTVKRGFSTRPASLYKVTVLGAGGGIGQPLSMLLKLNTRVTDLRLFDLRGAQGVAADLSHVPTASVVRGYTSEDPEGLKSALTGTEVVVIPAGVPRKPGMSRDDLFVKNAGAVQGLATAIAEHAPNAAVLVISNPVNSTVPIVAEVFKKHGTYNPRKLFGVTTLDVIRASRFLSELRGTNPRDEHVSIVGGHSGITIIPLLSQTGYQMSDEQRKALIHRIQFGGDEVVQAKQGAGSATLSMAIAGARFAGSVMDGLSGEADVVEAAFVDSPLFKDEGVEFFSSLLTLGKDGVEKVHELGPVSAEEEEMLRECKETLRKNIAKGVEFVKQH
ncbi:HDR164Cp [Eremothecium sinecaudum]|uniref:Malate dehydrogenase n=1 Tax=Eremothecium sinecaudum TaxID=45286 RepID=A0A0X8HS93_9SACH|nr:HDR164Cp [Eremothecium sinecaudum]AMD20906.1 HDR164Cp [Eremothecium sinecaudum]